MTGPADAADLDTVRRIVFELLGDLPVRVFLFGSAARGAMRRTSDIDIALLSDRPLPRERLARLREALEEAPILQEVDVVDLAGVDEAMRRRILAEGIEWTAPRKD
jgi:predicted nucleotidyltransferase